MPALDDWIASFQDLSRLDERTAEICAEKLDKHVKATAAAGQTPAGQAWAPKKDGGRAMANAAAHIETKAHGNLVRQTLTGADVFHQFSEKKSEPRRQVIPDAGAGTPPEVAAIAAEASAQAWDEIVGGAGRR